MNAVTIEYRPKLRRDIVRGAIMLARRRRRRRALLWAMLAIIALFSSWELSYRLDEIAYGGVVYNDAIP